VPRLTGGFRYAPPENAKAPLSKRERHALSEAAAAIRRERSLHASGILALLFGRNEQAVLLLERAAAKSPRNAEILSDLAAAYLVRAEALDQPIDLIAALNAAETAVVYNPASLEALFNRALARQRLSLSTQAVRSWREYLDREKDPGWSAEVRAALIHLQPAIPAETWPDARKSLQQAVRRRDQKTVTALVARFPQEARTFAEEEILGRWADHLRQRDAAQAEDDLATARAIGQGLVQTSGESMLADSVAGIEQALHGDPARLHLLIESLAAYQNGLRLVRDRKFGRAEAPLERAGVALQQAASPFAAWASFLLVRCAYQRSDYAEVEKRAHALLLGLDIAKYPVVAARTRWVLGTAQMGLARPAEALDSYRFALVQFERTRETVHRAAVHSLLSGVFDELGDGSSAWQHRALALRGLADHRDPERLRVALTNVAFAALDAGSPRAALLLQTEAVEIARSQNHPERRANTLLNRAAILDRTGLADPQDDLRSARSDCDRIEDPSIRQSILAELLAAEGRWLSRKAPARSLAPLGRALELYRAAGRSLMLPGLLGTRAAALRGVGRIGEAEADLKNAIEVLEEERGSVPEGEQRASFSDRIGGVFDAMVLLQTERGHPDLALEYSERRRARLLLDWLSAMPQDLDARRFRLETWTRPRPLQELRERIPAGVVAVVYEVLPDRLLLWVVRSGGSIEQRQVRISAAQVAERVRRLEQAVSGSENRLRLAGAALHELLVQPVSDRLRPGETLVFVPESPLDSVPFALLFDPRTGRHLIEDRLFAIAPSLSLFAQLVERRSGETFADADVVVLANPAFDQSLFPLPPLPGADEEGRWVRGLYSRARIVAGASAGREALLEGLGRARILHFGGHALANSRKPFLSSLLLAPRPARDDSGVLYARELIGTPGGRTDLVILSACRSAGGAAAGEGVAGLVWPFFSRGVPMVIASTRAVEDRATAAVFAAFYRHLARGEPPVAALREAQLEALAASRAAEHPSFDWAAFQLYGADHGTEASKGGER
jgi:CHAT domain-containing protein/tetratricopeptide (TPR) repeat protein